MTITIKEVAFVCHPVSDIARARDFYGRVLGLRVGMEKEFRPGAWWIEYDIAGVSLAVTNTSPPVGTGGASLALEVDDFEGSLAAIRAARVPLTQEPKEYPEARVFTVNSPDGHPIMFHQRKA